MRLLDDPARPAGNAVRLAAIRICVCEVAARDGLPACGVAECSCDLGLEGLKVERRCSPGRPVKDMQAAAQRLDQVGICRCTASRGRRQATAVERQTLPQAHELAPASGEYGLT